jgi:hypothetical protein
MWSIQFAINIDNNSNNNFSSLQIFEKHLTYIYDSIESICNEDYKTLNNILQQHIVKYINNMPVHKIELFVYNNDNKKYTNTSSKSLLFIIFYNMFNICYITNYKNDSDSNSCLSKYYPEYSIIIIQRFWRKILSYRMETNKYKIYNDITYLINKINNEIVGESAKKILLYLVNKFKKRISRTLRI